MLQTQRQFPDTSQPGRGRSFTLAAQAAVTEVRTHARDGDAQRPSAQLRSENKQLQGGLAGWWCWLVPTPSVSRARGSCLQKDVAPEVSCQILSVCKILGFTLRFCEEVADAISIPRLGLGRLSQVYRHTACVCAGLYTLAS